MHKFGVALIFMVFTPLVSALEGTPYLSVKGGVVSPKSGYMEVQDTGDNTDLTYDDNQTYEVAIGLDYSRMLLEQSRMNARFELAYSVLDNEVEDTAFEVKTTNIFLNGYFGIPHERMTPYGMLGIGAIDLELDDNDGSGSWSNRDVGFQLGLGVAYKLAEHLFLDLDYKFVMAGKMTFEDFSDDGDVDLEYEAHVAQLGLRVLF